MMRPTVTVDTSYRTRYDRLHGYRLKGPGTMAIEYRIRYSASSNASFKNDRFPEWYAWHDPEATEVDVLKIVNGDHEAVYLPLGLEMALEASGFEWNVETREVQS